MLSYSPYDNLKRGELSGDAGEDIAARQPGDVLGAGQVCGQAAHAEDGRNPLLLVTNMQAGHGGASGRYDYLKEIALDYAFLLRELGAMEWSADGKHDGAARAFGLAKCGGLLDCGSSSGDHGLAWRVEIRA
jgi:hypothetical protein